jgi:predicted 3-demethylubiquinone-9 3-methyltransferase (glyoxalase superfamily)
LSTSGVAIHVSSTDMLISRAPGSVTALEHNFDERPPSTNLLISCHADRGWLTYPTRWCGWYTDRFGVSWLIAPDRLCELFSDLCRARVPAATARNNALLPPKW